MTRVPDRRRWGRAIMATMLALSVAGSLTACDRNGTPGPTTSDAPPGGTGSVGDVGPGDSTDSGALAIAGVSVIVDRTTLMLPDGRTIPLDAIEGGGNGGYQTRDGWLIQGYGNGGDTLSLWLVRTEGTLLKLVDKAEGPVAVAADGRRIAWRSAGRLNVGTIDPNSGVKVDKSSAAPARGHPLALTGDSVILGYSETGGGIDHHDVWIPGLGEYTATWEKSAHVRAVYGPAARNGSSYLGLVQGPAGGKDTCIAEMNPRDSLKATRTACGLALLIDRFGAVSPDGNWLAYHSADASGRGQIAVVDVRNVFTKPTVSVGWSADVVGAWEDATTMLALGLGGGLVRYRLGSATAEPVDRPGLSKDSRIELLPRLS
jgi:hypothetical protein